MVIFFYFLEKKGYIFLSNFLCLVIDGLWEYDFVYLWLCKRSIEFRIIIYIFVIILKVNDKMFYMMFCVIDLM